MEELKRKAFEIIEGHQSGDVLRLDEAKILLEYCCKVREEGGDSCGLCELRKRFGTCPIVVSVP
ncbi:MAG: hypothetical protein QXK47_03950 [Candidatus Bathyarchaeia archaeon]